MNVVSFFVVDSTGSNVGAIAGGIFASLLVVVILLILIVVVWVIILKFRNNDESDQGKLTCLHACIIFYLQSPIVTKVFIGKLLATG